jgi:predicted PurR-regulated permease PerM
MAQRTVPRFVFALAALVVVGWMVYQALQAVLIFITAAILATGLHQGAYRLSRKFGGPRKAWLGVIILLVAGIFVGIGWIAGPHLTASFSDLQSSLSEAWKRVSSMEVVKHALGHPRDGEELSNAISSRLTTFGEELGNLAAGVMRALTGMLLIFALALFLVWNPDLYESGVLSLFPRDLRPRLAEVLHKIGESLWFWLTGQGVAMLIIGVLTGLGLWMIGMKFALMLGIIAGLFQLIPYVGPFLSAIPGIVLALAESPRMALLAGSVYVGVQLVESNFITPTVLRSRASLPPVLTLIATVAFGLIFGPLGFIIATPLTLVVLVIYRELYSEMVLGEDGD